MKEPGFIHCRRPVSLILIAICVVLNSCHRSDDRVVQESTESRRLSPEITSPAAFVTTSAPLRPNAPAKRRLIRRDGIQAQHLSLFCLHKV
jgi:hypothetical protein